MKHLIKIYWTRMFLIIAFGVASFFAVKWKIEMVNFEIGMAYWEGVRNTNMVLDCYNRPPSAYELVRLRNTNLQSCGDVSAFIKQDNPWKVAEEGE